MDDRKDGMYKKMGDKQSILHKRIDNLFKQGIKLLRHTMKVDIIYIVAKR